MNIFTVSRLLQLQKSIIAPIEYYIQVNNYAVSGILTKGKKTKGPTVEKKVLPVETDVEKLIKYCCGTNLLKEGGEDVEIKPDSEYPDWLWTIRTGPAPTLDELDPNTKQYWRLVRKLAIKRQNKLKSLRKF